MHAWRDVRNLPSLALAAALAALLASAARASAARFASPRGAFAV